MDLLILGASVRAASYSSLRAGFCPRGADLFADSDALAVGSIAQIDSGRYPESLGDFARSLEPTPWIYTGALENQPELVDRISEHHPLLGNPGSILRPVRDPFQVAEVLTSSGLSSPGLQNDPLDVPVDGSWLVKPWASAGGSGIRIWSGIPTGRGRNVFYQQRVAGLSLSALYLGFQAGCRCLGVTRQYVGRPGNRFGYRGSLAPWPLEDEAKDQIERIGQRLFRELGLLGLFGVDLVLDDRHQVWAIEVNPRYTASIEALEWATGQTLIADHAQVFGIKGADHRLRPVAEGFVAKAILYARKAISIDHHDRFSRDQDITRMPEIADIPRPGTRFEFGDPVMTVLASGDHPEDCRRKLAGRIRHWHRRLDDWSI